LPEICRFLGISIRMYFNDHNPPHFHVQYESHRAQVAIQELRLVKGELPPRVRALVLEWADLHRNELLANWESLRHTGTFEPIEPLV
jgi:uncharacterized protein DUF4160